MSEPTFDAQGNLHLGPRGDNSEGRLTVDFSPNEQNGIALHVNQVPGDASNRAGIQLGDFLLAQDPTKGGLSTFGIQNAAGDTVYPFQLLLYLQFLDAQANFVHMDVDTSLSAYNSTLVADTADQDACNARANLLKAAFATHAASVGSRTAAGYHEAEDVANAATLAAVADATDLASSITLINALLVAINAHRQEAGVHFNDDTVAVTITTDPPVLIADVRADLDDLLDAYQTHFALAVQ